MLDGTTDNYPLTAEYSEPGEVDDIQWIPLSQVPKYRWAFGQHRKVLEQAKTTLGYEKGVVKNDLQYQINALRNELRKNPYAEQLFDSILNKITKNV